MRIVGATTATTAAKCQKKFGCPRPERPANNRGTFASAAGLSTPFRSSFEVSETAAPFKIKPLNSRRRMVGVAGFEPTTPCPPDKCANRAALHSDLPPL